MVLLGTSKDGSLDSGIIEPQKREETPQGTVTSERHGRFGESESCRVIFRVGRAMASTNTFY